MAFYKDIADVEAIHSHGGKTTILFDSPTRLGAKALRGAYDRVTPMWQLSLALKNNRKAVCSFIEQAITLNRYFA